MLFVWSGGCDSTLMLHRALTGEIKVDEFGVRAISFSHPQIGAEKEQRAARREFIGRMKARGLKFEHQEVRVQQSKGTGAVQGHNSLQPMMWLGLAIQYLHPGEDLVMGYIQEDDFWHWADSFKKAFKTLARLSGKYTEDKWSELQLPLEWVTKKQVILALRKAKIITATYWCEDGRSKASKKCKPVPAGLIGRECHSCKRHRLALVD